MNGFYLDGVLKGRYHLSDPRGEVGLMVTGGMAPNREGGVFPGAAGLFTPEDIANHRVVTDRIELGTYMLAPAICGGTVTCLGGRRSLLGAFCDKLEAEQHAERAAARRSQVGSGDRSERIRTYNFPDNRITDHRINFTLYKLDQVIAGDMQPVTDALIDHDRRTLRGEMGDLD